MEDIFVEHIVKRKTELSSLLIRIGCVLLTVVCLLIFPLLGMLAITIFALMIYLTYLAWQYTSVEYEYSFLNGEISVDRILGQRKRKHVASYEMKDAEIMADAESEDILRRIRGDIKVNDFSTGIRENRKYAVIFNGAKGTVELIFEPNKSMLEAIKKSRPGIVHIASDNM